MSNFASSSSSSVPQNQWKYHTFLSFVEDDTEIKSFTDFLYDAIKQKGLHAFNYEAQGKTIVRSSEEFLKAIKESMISVVIFSKKFASSIHCLDELVGIMDLARQKNTVLPVFYDVNPSDVRKQTGVFQELFSEHQQNFSGEKLKRWRDALTQAADMSGFTLQRFNGYERELIEAIVNDISSKLSPMMRPNALTELVGMSWRLDRLISQMDLGSDPVRFIGIHGMGGIGKTTLARAFYDQMSCLFDASCFLADVRKGGLVSLQEQLASQILNESTYTIRNPFDGLRMVSQRFQYKKVLIVVDDVDNINQLEQLVGSRDWFGKGSRIIITTRDEHLLTGHGVDAVYKAELLNSDEALKLLYLKAFKNESPPDNKYLEMCQSVVKCVKRLPLALKVLGSFLYGRSVDEWKAALKRLKEDPDKDILNCLQISFDSLHETEKQIFLDIAFFFTGMHKDKDYVIEVLKSCDFYPDIGVKVLIERSLISLSDENKFLVHDLLEDMAKKIVEREHPKKPAKRSRLCKEKDVYDVLMNCKGTDAIEGITHKFSKEKEVNLPDEAFANMENLRILKISNAKLSQGLDYLSNELRYLEWREYLSSSLPSGFLPDEIVILKLPFSRIQDLWQGVKVLDKLKVIDLSYSQNLKRMSNLEGVPNLEILKLECCKELSELDPSIGFLKKLVILDLKLCVNLPILPNFISLESLEVCDLRDCAKLVNFPEIKSRMDSLWKLDLRGTAIKSYDPSFFHFVKNVQVLNLGQSTTELTGNADFLSSLRDFSRLTCLALPYCKLDDRSFPNFALGQLSSLIDLNLSGNDFVSLPAFIGQLSNLKNLFLTDCKNLKSLEGLPPNVSLVNVLTCSSLEEWLEQLHRQEFGSSSGWYWEFEGIIDAPNLIYSWSWMTYRYGSYHLLQYRPTKFHHIKIASEIPEGFMYLREGNSMRMECGSCDWNKKSVGMLACCVLSVDDNIQNFPMPDHAGTSFGPYYVGVQLRSSTNDLRIDVAMLLTEEAIGTDYVWVASIQEFGKFINLESNSNIITITFVTVAYDSNGTLYHSNNGIEVKRCGVSLLSF